MNFSSDNRKNQVKIDAIDVTSDVLTSRGGVSLFYRYVNRLGILDHLSGCFAPLRERRSGISPRETLKQIMCFFSDGTQPHLTYFDELHMDSGYAASIETHPSQMASSHQIKRFVGKVSFARTFTLRKSLQRLFIESLKASKPEVIVLGIDTMVMNNDDADRREGVKPTYKKVKGFQPLQMYWDGRIVDAVFRGGDKHSNHSDTVEKMIIHMVRRIRKEYRDDVAILIQMDSGFFDQALFDLCESMHVGYICGGKQYKDIVDYISGYAESEWSIYEKSETERWEYLAFRDRRASWKTERRALYCRYQTEATGQGVLAFARRDTVIYTNLGMDEVLTEQLKRADRMDVIEDAAILKSYHQRAVDELTNRGVKEFCSEHLPFERFESNMFWYYMMLVSYFVFETFKRDVVGSLVTKLAYPNTVRRRVMDIAVKMTRHAGQTILKVTRGVWEMLDFGTLWRRSGEAIPIAW